VEEYDPTIEDSYSKTFQHGEGTYNLELLDTAGQEEYSAMREAYMYDGESFVLAFAKNNRDSFDALIDFAELISRVRDTDIKNVPVVVVGNKNDLPADEIQVDDEEGRSFAERLGAEYVSCSALTGLNIDSIFENVVERVEKYKAEEQAEDNKKMSGKKGKKTRRRLRLVDGTCKML
jgi:GTPase KRas protein